MTRKTLEKVQSEPLAANEKDVLRKELELLLNRYSVDAATNTPDFILASYLVDCLDTFDKFAKWRDKWYGVKLEPGMPHVIFRGEKSDDKV